uniref:Uncharacterized protein n=1 Tax=Hemiselmis andersenii TaxID=464988 RepID=A0A7S1HDC4_HEMAN|mmetsp:Transcript_54884/g.132839  ORF Transcript_54884/g.132839 Transcript_54884/m.132839 type:complete len:172 (+) Transcript_54884:33-548(+)
MSWEREEAQPLLSVDEESEERAEELEVEDVALRNNNVSPIAMLGAGVGALAVLLLMQSFVLLVHLIGFGAEGIRKGSAAAWMMTQGWRVGGLQRLGAQGLRAMMPLGAVFLVIGAFGGVAMGIKFAHDVRRLAVRAQLHWQGLHGGGLRRQNPPVQREQSQSERRPSDDGL